MVPYFPSVSQGEKKAPNLRRPELEKRVDGMIEAISYNAITRTKTLNIASSLIANMAERITDATLRLPEKVGWSVS